MNASFDIVMVVLAGVLGTLGMTAFAYGFRRIGILPVNAIQVIGSTVTGANQNAMSVGWGIHALFGLLFAFAYNAVIQFLGAAHPIEVVSACLVLGALHGIFASFLLVISVSEHHPLHRHRGNAGLGLAGVYFLAHIVYGLIVGTVLALGTTVPSHYV